MSTRSELLVFYCRSPYPIPGEVLEIDAGRPPTLAALVAFAQRPHPAGHLLVAFQRDAATAEPAFADLHPVGVIVRVRKITRRGPESMNLDAVGVARARLISIDTNQAEHRATIQHVDDTAAILPARVTALEDWMARTPERFNHCEVPRRPSGITDGAFVDLAAGSLRSPWLDHSDRLDLLQEIDVARRLERLIATSATK